MTSWYAKAYWKNQTPSGILFNALKFDASLVDIYLQHKNIFDLDVLGPSEKVKLLQEHFDIFKDEFDLSKFNERSRVDLFLKDPKKYEHLLDFSCLSKECTNTIAACRPSLITKYNIPLNLKVDGWIRLIRYNREYLLDYFKLLPTVRNATEVRKFFEVNDEFIMLLTPEVIEDTILSAKEWLFMIERRKLLNPEVEIREELFEYLKMELSIELLSATSAHSNKLSKTMQKFKQWGYE